MSSTNRSNNDKNLFYFIKNFFVFLYREFREVIHIGITLCLCIFWIWLFPFEFIAVIGCVVIIIVMFILSMFFLP